MPVISLSPELKTEISELFLELLKIADKCVKEGGEIIWPPEIEQRFDALPEHPRTHLLKAAIEYCAAQGHHIESVPPTYYWPKIDG